MSVKVCQEIYPELSDFDISQNPLISDISQNPLISDISQNPLISDISKNFNLYFKEFPYELSPFQKHSIEAIVSGHDSLVIANTGSGKTLPAEFAIRHFSECHKKILYISPIKALSNQKYYDFCKKFPDLEFGLVTGDVKKSGPDANCIIMTSEILRNKLFNSTSKEFDLNLDDVAILVIDEVHYINDPDRGTVWEEIIISLPKHIQLLMLSATIDEPEQFATWVSSIRTKSLWISGSSERVVPLKHYSMIFFSEQNIMKTNILNSEEKELLSKYNNKLLLLKNASEPIHKDTHDALSKIFRLVHLKRDNSYELSKTHIINELVKFLKQEGLVPAIFFSLSRKNVENYAKLVETNLLDNGLDNHKISTASSECRKIISRLPNYKEYLLLPEYREIVSLLEKGIAFHHSGLLAIYREMIELMFEKGYVKLLFATETFAVGINLPTKTVIFDSFSKFDGTNRRLLKSHEYSQMSGRAGRRSIDIVGHVIHLNNLFDLPSLIEYTEIMSGRPLKFSSKFNIDYSLVLRFLKNYDSHSETTLQSDIINYISKSSLSNEISISSKYVLQDLENITKQILEYRLDNVVEQYYILKNSKPSNKIKKDIIKLKDQCPKIDILYENYLKYIKLIEQKKYLENELLTNEQYFERCTTEIIDNLIKNGFLLQTNILTDKGLIACNINEAHSLVIPELLTELNNYDVYQIIMILSSFSDKVECLEEPDSKLREIFEFIKNLYIKYNVPTEINVNLCNYVNKWSEASNQEECIEVLSSLIQEGIYIGSFTKCILKINNIVQEILVNEDIIEVSLRYKLSQISDITLKFMITNQSLYLNV